MSQQAEIARKAQSEQDFLEAHQLTPEQKYDKLAASIGRIGTRTIRADYHLDLIMAAGKKAQAGREETSYG